MKIFIPSKNRISVPVFKQFEVFPKDDKFIFVEPQDYEIYFNMYNESANIINIGKNDKGFGYVLDFMNKYAQREGIKTWLFVDDDCEGFYEREDKKLVLMKDSEQVENMLEKIHSQFENSNVAQWGISFCAHNRFFEGDFQENKAAWCVYFNNARDIEAVGGFDTNAVIFNDYEISARLILNGYKTIIDHRYAFKHKMGSKKGGAESIYKKVELTKQNAEYMLKKYGSQYVTMAFHEEHGIWEIRFDFKALSQKKQEHNWW